MSDSNSRSADPQLDRQGVQIRILDVLIIMVGVGAFCGIVSQIVRDDPAIPLLWGLLIVGLAVATWLVVVGLRRDCALSDRWVV